MISDEFDEIYHCCDAPMSHNLLFYCLSMSFFSSRIALEKAEVLLNLKHGIVRLDNVWGVGGGIRPVKVLIKKVNVTIK